MEKTNYALISALYSNADMGLYKDIYFPIIKYAIVKLYADAGGMKPYKDSEDVFTFIKDKFGLTIPKVVIERTIVKLSKRSSNIKLEVFEDGKNFRIIEAYFDNGNKSIDEKEVSFSDQLKAIDEEYLAFIEREGTVDDKVSFVGFISDNTDDVLGYFETQDINRVDEKYATMVFFLQYLNKEKKQMFDVANQLFWGSIIAGFLKSNRPSMSDNYTIDSQDYAEYFIDTPIVLGLLGLSIPERETSAEDVSNIIKASGGLLRVHPMTVYEVKEILRSVEINGPNPMSPIGIACERKGLTTNDLSKIRLNICAELDKKMVNVFPNIGDNEIRKTITTYKTKDVTKLLGKERNKKPFVDADYYENNFREVHDVFMDDYIKNRRSAMQNDRVFFLTNNKDLITFCERRHEGLSNMMWTRTVVLELWMYNSPTAEISSCQLAETMARCLDLHNDRVKKQVAEVSRFYNKTKDDFNPEIYKDFIRELYRRARNVISSIDNLDNKSNREIAELISDAVSADRKFYSETVIKARELNKDLAEEIKKKDAIIDSKESDLEALKKKLEREKKEKELHKRKADLRDSTERLHEIIEPFERSKEKSFLNWPPMVCLIVAIIILLLLLYCVFGEIPTAWTEKKDGIRYALGILLTVTVSLGIFLWRGDNVQNRKKKAFDKWEKTPDGVTYKQYKEQYDKNIEEMKAIDEALKLLENDSES